VDIIVVGSSYDVTPAAESASPAHNTQTVYVIIAISAFFEKKTITEQFSNNDEQSN